MAGAPEGKGAKLAALEIVRVVRACEKIRPLMLQEAFKRYFRTGKRRPGEGIQDFINCRETEYDTLVELSKNRT